MASFPGSLDRIRSNQRMLHAGTLATPVELAFLKGLVLKIKARIG
jgi:hypothetical protein